MSKQIITDKNGDLVIRYFLTSTGKRVGGWLVKAVVVDVNRIEMEAPSCAKFDTKKEAKERIDYLNERLKRLNQYESGRSETKTDFQGVK